MKKQLTLSLFSLLFILLMAATVLEAKEYHVIDIAGDSISSSYNPDYSTSEDSYGWVDMLYGLGGGNYPAPKEDTIDDLWPDIVKYNTAEAGSKASEWQPGSLYFERIRLHQPDLVVLLLGGNDLIQDYMGDGEFSAGEVAEYEANLTNIVSEIKSFESNPDILMLYYYDLFDGDSKELPLLLEILHGMTRATVDGNFAIQRVANAYHCELVDIYTPFFFHCYGRELDASYYLDPCYVETPLSKFDIHPNTDGHKKIYETVYERLMKLKNMPETTFAANWSLFSE